MKRHRIPTAKSKSFNSSQLEEALIYLEKSQSPYVLKADGLAAGKGVPAAEGSAVDAIIGDFAPLAGVSVSPGAGPTWVMTLATLAGARGGCWWVRLSAGKRTLIWSGAIFCNRQ